MRNFIGAALVVLATVSCGTSSKVALADKDRPEIQIEQRSGVAVVARHQQGPISVQYGLRITNRAGTNITLKRVNVQSMGEGAYSVGHSAPFDVVIGPDQVEEVEFWAAARTSPSVIGANGPVTLRVNCQFESPAGTFQQIVTRVVNAGSSVTGE